MRLILIAIMLSVSALSIIAPVLADYTVGPVPDIAVEQGEASSTIVRVTDDAVRFSVEGLPIGATASFTPQSCASPCEAKLTVKAGEETPAGTYSVLVKASAGSTSIGRLVNLTVTAPPAEAPVAGLFKRPSTWTEKVPANPNIARHSAKFIADLIGNSPKFGVAGDKGSAYPIWRAKKDTPIVKVEVSTGGFRNGIEARALGWDLVPIPPESVAQGGNDGTGDRHMIVIDHAGKHLWEFFAANKISEGKWRAAILRRYDLDADDGIVSPQDGMGTGRNCAPISQGLILLEEVKSGSIDHAISFAYNGTNSNHGDLYPCEDTGGAASTGGKREWSLYTGMRVQLDPALDLGALGLKKGEPAWLVARALQVYGGIFTDNAGVGNNQVHRESVIGKPLNFPPIASGVAKIPLDRIRLVETVPLPLISNQSGGAALFKAPVTVGLSVSPALTKLDVTGQRYHFTLDGSEPTTASPRYDGEIKIANSATLKVRGFKPGSISSGVRKVNFLAVGQEVKTVSDLSVRAQAAGDAIGKQDKGARGRIVAGPVSGWWKIDFDSGPDGWARTALIEKR